MHLLLDAYAACGTLPALFLCYSASVSLPSAHVYAHMPMPPAPRFINGETLVVDGGSWMYRAPLVPRAAVSQLSRAVEGKSRAVGVAGGGSGQRSKL